jgi:hypothetical protein
MGLDQTGGPFYRDLPPVADFVDLVLPDDWRWRLEVARLPTAFRDDKTLTWTALAGLDLDQPAVRTRGSRAEYAISEMLDAVCYAQPGEPMSAMSASIPFRGAAHGDRAYQAALAAIIGDRGRSLHFVSPSGRTDGSRPVARHLLPAVARFQEPDHDSFPPVSLSLAWTR